VKPTEEHRRVVRHKVPVALSGLELDREPTGVPREVRRSSLAADCGEADCERAFHTFLEHIRHAEVLETVGAFPCPVCAGSFRMDDSLGNPASYVSCDYL